jgi:CHAT domain-containing protein
MLSGNAAIGDTGLPPRLKANLRTLARALLPTEVFGEPKESASSANALFLVTTDGFLGQIPFEAFDVGEAGKYKPLLLTRDVAYMRFADTAKTNPRQSPGVIVVNPPPSNELRKRYLFPQRLEHAELEGQLVADIDPGATFLKNESASKTRLQEVWEDAGYLYFATHILRHPTVRYLSLVPMAVDDDKAVERGAGYLDMTDVRTADLRRVDIAVLSGCSTGAPYVTAGIAGPGFGDAFLDAGAGAVVQTFWDVRDDTARDLMTSYFWLWHKDGMSCVEALNEARRRAFEGAKTGDPAFAWASYAIKIGRL